MTLLSAIRSILLGDGPLMLGLPGGIWHKVAPPRHPYPLATFRVISMTEPSGPGGKSYGLLSFSAHGPDPDACRASVSRAREVIAGKPLGCDKGTAIFPDGPVEPTMSKDADDDGMAIHTCSANWRFLIGK